MIGPIIWNHNMYLQACKPLFSHGTPSISTVIPAMDHINTHLTTASQNISYSVSISAIFTIGKKTLNWYYNKTDQSEFIELQWVSLVIADIDNLSFLHLSQAPLFQDCWMGKWLDWNGAQHHSWGVWENIFIHRFWQWHWCWGVFNEQGMRTIQNIYFFCWLHVFTTLN